MLFTETIIILKKNLLLAVQNLFSKSSERQIVPLRNSSDDFEKEPDVVPSPPRRKKIKKEKEFSRTELYSQYVKELKSLGVTNDMLSQQV